VIAHGSGRGHQPALHMVRPSTCSGSGRSLRSNALVFADTLRLMTLRALDQDGLRLRFLDGA
jgi:hypothetical protein